MDCSVVLDILIDGLTWRGACARVAHAKLPPPRRCARRTRANTTSVSVLHGCLNHRQPVDGEAQSPAPSHRQARRQARHQASAADFAANGEDLGRGQTAAGDAGEGSVAGQRRAVRPWVFRRLQRSAAAQQPPVRRTRPTQTTAATACRHVAASCTPSGGLDASVEAHNALPATHCAAEEGRRGRGPSAGGSPGRPHPGGPGAAPRPPARLQACRHSLVEHRRLPAALPGCRGDKRQARALLARTYVHTRPWCPPELKVTHLWPPTWWR